MEITAAIIISIGIGIAIAYIIRAMRNKKRNYQFSYKNKKVGEIDFKIEDSE